MQSAHQGVAVPLITFFRSVVAGEVDEDAAIHQRRGRLGAAGARRHHRQDQHQGEIIIRRDAVEALKAAAQAAMHQHMLAAGALERANGGHPRATGIEPVARLARVYVARMQAKWAMVAVPAARWHGRDEAATVHAFKNAFGGVATGAPHGLGRLAISIVELGRLVAI